MVVSNVEGFQLLQISNGIRKLGCVCVCVCVCGWVGGWVGGCACVHVCTSKCQCALTKQLKILAQELQQ